MTTVIKLTIAFAFLASVRAGVLSPAVAIAKTAEAQYDPNPQYSFGYDVQDASTGDSKSQVETRIGDVVRGQYTVDDPDGTTRIVDYTADPVNGFNAFVRKTPNGKLVGTPAVVPASPVVSTPVIPNPVVAESTIPGSGVEPVVRTVTPLNNAVVPTLATLNNAVVPTIATPITNTARVSIATPVLSRFSPQIPQVPPPLVGTIPPSILSARTGPPVLNNQIVSPYTTAIASPLAPRNNPVNFLPSVPFPFGFNNAFGYSAFAPRAFPVPSVPAGFGIQQFQAPVQYSNAQFYNGWGNPAAYNAFANPLQYNGFFRPFY